MDIEALKESYPQVDMSKPHKLHIKVSIDEKDKLMKLSEKIHRTESKICVEAIITQMPLLEERLVNYNHTDFCRKKGDFLFDVDIILPPELFLRLLFYKETFQSFSIGLIVRMMLDDFLESVNEEDEELTILESEIRHKSAVREAHKLFLGIKRMLATISVCIIQRIKRFSAGMSDDMIVFWNTMLTV